VRHAIITGCQGSLLESWLLKGIIMKLKPFSDIKPRNLGLLLFVARFLTYFGFALIGIATVLIAATTFEYIFPSPPVSQSAEVYGTTLDGVKVGFLIIGGALLVIVFSNFLAAIVSWESSLPVTSHNDK
tara:strand:+ start:268 stop:654 length:387 start_codon:yes stop_codon:yes gene_type:complete